MFVGVDEIMNRWITVSKQLTQADGTFPCEWDLI